MNRSVLFCVALSCLTASQARAAPQAQSEEPQAQLKPTTPVATIDGQPIPYSEIEGAIHGQLNQAWAEFLSKVYDLRRSAVDQLIQNRVIEAEARKAGKTVKDWVEQDFLSRVPEPKEEDLKKLYEDNKAKLGGLTFEQAKDRLRDYLKRLGGRNLFASYLPEMETAHGVKVLLTAPEPVRVAVEAKGPSRGAERARITVVEFSDFQCPYCGRVTPVLNQVLKDYEGKVKVVYRQFPLSFHAMAEKAAEASLCALDQGKFWEMHDRMFADQTKLDPEDLKAAAKDLGLDVSKFTACLDAGEKTAAVASDEKAGETAGVKGTPAFFVNGVLLDGAVPYAQFKAIIDRELERG